MKKALTVVVCLLLIIAAIAGGLWLYFKGQPDALRDIVFHQCVPNQQRHDNPAPCAEVKLDAGLVIFKDRNGPLQYLLMPTWRINGIESPMLLHPKTPNYFWQAWQARRVMSERNGEAVPNNVVSLTLNSKLGRTQNHLHIHISCLRPDVREKLNREAARISSQWLPLPGGIDDTPYLVRRVSEAELARRSPLSCWRRKCPVRVHTWGASRWQWPSSQTALLCYWRPNVICLTSILPMPNSCRTTTARCSIHTSFLPSAVCRE